MRVRVQALAALSAALVGMVTLVAPSGAAPAGQRAPGERYTPGDSGAGDAYFPFAGNGGYDVRHYDLDITYTPPAPPPAPIVGQLSGVATIDLVAT